MNIVLCENFLSIEDEDLSGTMYYSIEDIAIEWCEGNGVEYER